MYDPQIVRFHTLDPLAEKFIHQSPFVYADNNPIRYIDFLGLSAREPDRVDPNVYDIDPVYIVHTRPPPKQNTVPWGLQFLGFGLNPTWDANQPRSQNPTHLVDLTDFLGIRGGKYTHPALEWLRSFLGAASNTRNLKEKAGESSGRTKIVGDKGAIEATIDDKFKEYLEESNEPTQAPEYVRTKRERLPSGHETLRKIYRGAPDTIIVLQRESRPPYGYIRYPVK